MTLKVYIGSTPVENIFLGGSHLPKVALGQFVFSEYSYVSKLEFANKLLFVRMYKKK